MPIWHKEEEWPLDATDIDNMNERPFPNGIRIKQDEEGTPHNKSLQYSGLESCWIDPLPVQVSVVPF